MRNQLHVCGVFEVTSEPLVVIFAADQKARSIIAEELQNTADVIYLTDVEAHGARAEALRRASAVLARNTARELKPAEQALIGGARLLQFMSAGVDFIPLQDLPPELPIAGNGGAYAEPMAEHAVAMALAAAKRLFIEHAKLSQGEFNQFAPNRMLAGGV